MNFDSEAAEGIQFTHFNRFKSLNKVETVNSKAALRDVTKFLQPDTYSKLALYIKHEQFKNNLFCWRLDRVTMNKLEAALQRSTEGVAKEQVTGSDIDFDAVKSKLLEMSVDHQNAICETDDQSVEHRFASESYFFMQRSRIR